MAVKDSEDKELIHKLDGVTLKELHQVFLNMYKDIATVCKKLGIKVYLIGGSALGAVRHKGFIPWDDDMDLSMTRVDYEIFKYNFERELGDKYILNSPNYTNRSYHKFPRILKKNSYYKRIVSPLDNNFHRIMIDIFLIESTPNNLIQRKLKGFFCSIVSVISWEVYLKENRSAEMKEYFLARGLGQWYKRMIVGYMFSFIKSASWFNYYDKMIQYKKPSDYSCIATGRKGYLGEVFRNEVFFPGKEYEFEGEKVYLFEDTDNYLRNLYGEYMEIPPAANREHHNVCDIILDTSDKNGQFHRT